MATYAEHPSRAGRYERGEFVVYPDSLAENATVWFAFDPDGERWEGILAIRDSEEDRARLVGIPLWTYGVNLGDVVEVVDSGEGAPVAVRVVEPSEHRTYRVVFADLSPGDDDDRWRGVQVDLEGSGCWFDVLSPGYFAISVPRASVEVVERYLAGRASVDALTFESAVDPDR